VSNDSNGRHNIFVSSSPPHRSQSASPVQISRIGHQQSSANDANSNSSHPSSPLSTPPMQRLTITSGSPSLGATAASDATSSPAAERSERALISRHLPAPIVETREIGSIDTATTAASRGQGKGYSMSAAEARDLLRMQRQRDRARILGMTVNEKYNIYQQL
jgi:hypothetical protein